MELWLRIMIRISTNYIPAKEFMDDSPAIVFRIVTPQSALELICAKTRRHAWVCFSVLCSWWWLKCNAAIVLLEQETSSVENWHCSFSGGLVFPPLHTWFLHQEESGMQETPADHFLFNHPRMTNQHSCQMYDSYRLPIHTMVDEWPKMLILHCRSNPGRG